MQFGDVVHFELRIDLKSPVLAIRSVTKYYVTRLESAIRKKQRRRRFFPSIWEKNGMCPPSPGSGFFKAILRRKIWPIFYQRILGIPEGPETIPAAAYLRHLSIIGLLIIFTAGSAVASFIYVFF